MCNNNHETYLVAYPEFLHHIEGQVAQTLRRPQLTVHLLLIFKFDRFDLICKLIAQLRWYLFLRGKRHLQLL